MALSPWMSPCKTLHDFSSVSAVSAQDEMACSGYLPSVESWFYAKHCIDLVDGKPPALSK